MLLSIPHDAYKLMLYVFSKVKMQSYENTLYIINAGFITEPWLILLQWLDVPNTFGGIENTFGREHI